MLIKSIKDIDNMPQEYLLEFSKECFRVILHLADKSGLTIGKGINFTPDGLGIIEIIGGVGDE
jgi:hypothetical protein